MKHGPLVRRHPHVEHPKPGELNHAPNGQFLARCGGCGKHGQGDFGAMGADHIAELMKASGWTRKGEKRGGWLCDECTPSAKRGAAKRKARRVSVSAVERSD